jgi:hypothetical protein
MKISLVRIQQRRFNHNSDFSRWKGQELGKNLKAHLSNLFEAACGLILWRGQHGFSDECPARQTGFLANSNAGNAAAFEDSHSRWGADLHK